MNKIFIAGNARQVIGLQALLPVGIGEILTHVFTPVGLLAEQYAQKNNIPCKRLYCARPQSEARLLSFYQAVISSGLCDGVLLLYDEFSFPMAYAYGLAKAYGLPVIKKKQLQQKAN